MNISQKFATITFTLGYYLRLLIFPHPLTWDYYPYHIPIKSWADPAVLFIFVLYITMLVVAFNGFRKKSILSFSILLFLIPLSIVSNILFPVGVFMSERFVYISSIGFILFIAYYIVTKPNGFLQTIFKRPYLVLMPVLLLFTIKTISRNTAWKDSKVLVATDVKTSSNSAKSNALYGKDLFDQAEKSKDQNEKAKLYDLSFQYCKKAFEMDRQMQVVNYILGTIYGRIKGDLNKAIYHLDNAMNLDPQNIESYNNLGIAYGMTKQYDKAIETFEKALKIAPKDSSVINNLIFANQITGNMKRIDELKIMLKEAGKQKKK